MKKNMFKTGTALFATAMMMAAVLTGCSGSDSGASTTAPADTTATTTEGSSADNSSASGDTTADVQKIIDAGKLKVGTKVDVPKFGYQNPETGKMEGVEVDLAYEIAGKIFGCTADEAKDKDLVTFQGVTAKTRGPLLDNGEVDLVIATYTITPERKEKWNFSDPYYTDAVGLLVLKDSGIESINDLDGKIIGVSQGSTTAKAFGE